jgi:hypothetical protein
MMCLTSLFSSGNSNRVTAPLQNNALVRVNRYLFGGETGMRPAPFLWAAQGIRAGLDRRLF